VKKSKIEWTHSTFNPWWGCTKISPGCKFCYAERDSKRYGYDVWGKVPRRYFGEAYWNNPLKWNRHAQAAGVRRRVFCASMADVFEDLAGFPDEEQIAQVQAQMRLWSTIKQTPWLDWQLLTKRPENILRECPKEIVALPNAWFGTSAEDQATLDLRWPILSGVPAKVLFLSLEPLLERVNCDRCFGVEHSDMFGWLPEQIHVMGGHRSPDWVIVGGESGMQARPFDIRWLRHVLKQGRGTLGHKRIALFAKQLGARPCDGRSGDGSPVEINLRDPHGGDWNEWPEDLRVREFPA
jgi:protein gp37